MSATTKSKVKPVASSNWLALQKKLPKSSSTEPARKRRKFESRRTPSPTTSSNLPAQPSSSKTRIEVTSSHVDSPESLRDMVLGRSTLSDTQREPGKYIALDCEMVGVGIDGAESSLARVSIVNFYGVVLMDEFVRQRERVVDYRTQWSGIRPDDMIKAKPFDEVQKHVSEVLKDRILVGHALHNDFKALLLSHPRPQTRDTQYYAHKFKVSKSNRVALRDLVKQELDLTIQSGEHSSVTDARATMAVFRLHRKQWEQGTRPLPKPADEDDGSSRSKKKRKKAAVSSGSEDESGSQDEKPSKGPAKLFKPDSFPGGGRRGVSSGLSTIVRVGGSATARTSGSSQKTKTKWWAELPGQSSSASKGSISLKK